MGNGLSRVTVVGPDRRMDLSLPGAVPIGELMPQLLALCTDDADRTRPVAWMLRPLGGSGLGWGASLESARVRDGSILELCPRSVTASRTVEDVRDATEDAVDRTVGTWSRRDTTTLALLTMAALAAILLGLPGVWTGSVGGGLVAVATAASTIWGSVTMHRKGLPLAAHALLAVGLAWVGALVLAATAASTLTSASRAGLSGAAIGCAALVATWAVPRFAAWSAGAAVVCGAGLGWAAIDLAGRPVQDAFAVGTVLGVLILGVLPRVCLAAGGLAGLDYAVRTDGYVEQATVTASLERSRSLLTGALLSTAALTGTGSVLLGLDESPLRQAHAVAIAGCLLLRARAFTQFPHVLTLVLAGTGTLLLVLIFDLADGASRPLTFPGVGVVVLASAIIARNGLAAPNEVARARGRRLLDTAESLIVATLIPLLAANLGILDLVHELVG